MHDIKSIRENPNAFDAALSRRGIDPAAAGILKLDEKRRVIIKDMQDLQARRNELSKAIGVAKKAGEDAADIMAEVAGAKDRLQALESEERDLGAQLDGLLAGISNLPAADVPDGRDESANVEIRRHGNKPDFDFAPKQHFELGEAMGLMDFEAAAKISGARFVVLTGALARLERALAAFMLDLHTREFGYREVSPPVLVRDAALYGTGQLPKFAEDSFRTEDGLWLIPTAEVPLTNLVRESVLDEKDLPIRVTAYTPCFRSEAGAAGKDTRGMLRQHQFNKVELVSVTAPEHSEEEHERMVSCAEDVLKRLGIHFRTVVLATGDLGGAANKTYDIEAWLPGQGAYREISSCSNCDAYQARRMKARFRRAGQKGTEFVHTLNGSGLAVGRTLIAVLENYQQADGSVTIPEALRSFMGGMETIPAGGE